MLTLKQLTARLPTLKELKAQFTDLTGLPANKANAFTICDNLGDRKMTTKADWEYAIANIIPEKTLKYQQDTIKDLITALESQTDKLLELNALYEAELQNPQDDEAIAKLKASAEAFKASNALYHEDFHNQLDEIEQLKASNKEAAETITSQRDEILNLSLQLCTTSKADEIIAAQCAEIERLQAMDQDNDALIARLRDEIRFLNGELAKAMKKPMREIQLEKRVQDLEDEIYDLQRELRKVRSAQGEASLDSIPTVKAFSDFCFSLPLEWVEVFVSSFLANSSDIKATYRELSRKFHPDANHNIKSADLFRTLRDSYEALKDAVGR